MRSLSGACQVPSPTTGVVVRLADLERERAAVLDAVRRFVNGSVDIRRFEWLYERGPNGPGVAWVAVEPAAGQVVGVASAFPRQMSVGTEVRRGWVLGDFGVDPAYRSLGVALRLQRACLAVVGAASDAGWYDFPSTRMVSIYQRLAIPVAERLCRFVGLLQTAWAVERAVGMRTVSRAVGVLGDALLTAARRRGKRQDVAVDVHEGRCGPEFSVLADRVGGRLGLCVRRTADYLNWRYVDHPFRRHIVMTGRRGGELLAYAVLAEEPQEIEVVDLFGVDNGTVLDTAIEGATALGRSRGARQVSVTLLESHPLVTALRTRGFWPRDTDPVVVRAGAAGGVHGAGPGSVSWFLTTGDRES